MRRVGKSTTLIGVVGTFLFIWPFSLSFLQTTPQKATTQRAPQQKVTNSFLLSATSEFSYLDTTKVLSWTVDAEKQTKDLLENCEGQPWSREQFQQACEVVNMWSNKSYRQSPIQIERLIRRMVEEKRSGNVHVESIDMLAMYNRLIRSWAKSPSTGAPERVEEIFHTMLRLHESNDIDFTPDVETFNGLLLAFSTSKRKDAPTETIRLFNQLLQLRKDGRTTILPNTESYAIILRCFAASQGTNAPDFVLQMIQRMNQFARDGYPAVKPDYKCYNEYLAALLNTITKHSIGRVDTATKMELFLQDMLNSGDPESKPDVWSFNRVILAWSRTDSPMMAEHAENLVSQLEAYHKECGNTTITEPNTITYNYLIACYSKSRMVDRAEKSYGVLQKMKDLHRKEGKINCRPDAITYNSVMSTYAKSRNPNATQMVENMLRELFSLYEETGDSKLRPSSRSFNPCLDAWAKSDKPEAADRIMGWINRMQESYMRGRIPVAPNKYTYNSYLEALAKQRHPDTPDKVEQLLDNMIEKVKGGQQHVKPDVLTFTNAIHCIAVSGGEDAFERAYKILLRMEDLHESGYGDVRPNAYTYNCVINAVAKSTLPGKAKIAVKLLRRMTNVSIRPNTMTFNNILNACAFSDPETENQSEILGIAMLMLKETQETCGANFITYGTALRVVGFFVDDPISRWTIARDLFRNCCEDGQLDRLVLKQLKLALIPWQYSLLIEEATDEKTGKLRKNFTRNGRNYRSSSGRSK